MKAGWFGFHRVRYKDCANGFTQTVAADSSAKVFDFCGVAKQRSEGRKIDASWPEKTGCQNDARAGRRGVRLTQAESLFTRLTAAHKMMPVLFCRRPA